MLQTSTKKYLFPVILLLGRGVPDTTLCDN